MFKWLFKKKEVPPKYKVVPCILFGGGLGYGIGEFYLGSYLLSPSLSKQFESKEDAQKAVNHLLEEV